MHFEFLSGLSVEKCNMLIEIISLDTDTIIYSDCKGSGTRTLGKLTELLTYFTLCRHSLHILVSCLYVRLWHKHCLSVVCWMGSFFRNFIQSIKS